MTFMKRIFFFMLVNMLVMVSVTILTGIICTFLYGSPTRVPEIKKERNFFFHDFRGFLCKSIGRIKGVFYEIKKYLMYSSLFSLTFLFLESPFRCHSDEILGWDLLKFSI